MEISAEKTKLMTNTDGINAEIKVSGEKLKTVNSLKYLRQFLRQRIKTRKSFQNCANNNCNDQTEASLELQKHHTQLEGQTDVRTSHL